MPETWDLSPTGAPYLPMETRDIAIETRTEVKALVSKLDTFMVESRLHREKLDEKMERYDALINRGWGAWLGLGAFSTLVGYVSHYIPHPALLGK